MIQQKITLDPQVTENPLDFLSRFPESRRTFTRRWIVYTWRWRLLTTQHSFASIVVILHWCCIQRTRGPSMLEIFLSWRSDLGILITYFEVAWVNIPENTASPSLVIVLTFGDYNSQSWVGNRLPVSKNRNAEKFPFPWWEQKLRLPLQEFP